MKLIDLDRSPILAPSNKSAKDVSDMLREAVSESEALASLLDKDSECFSFLTAALALSPFLYGIVAAKPDLLAYALHSDIKSQMDDIMARAKSAWRDEDGQPVSEADLMCELRQAKKQAALSLALYDLAQITTAKDTTQYLSDLASATLSAAIDHLLYEAHDRGKLVLKDVTEPSKDSGLIVLGMGKLGAGELNYSSDIDIVVFFEADAGIVEDRGEATDVFAKMARRLIHIMQHYTRDGYVFRTDLRLRPDPGSTPLAFPIEAAMHYYESRGQNWERAAYIKAQPVAGDLEAGRRFLSELQPFIFRKYLDFAAIADIHSIKRQIHAHRGLGDISVEGHNVKLGRGGIREIEFFVQTQQLIAGGRNPDLRVCRTDEAMEKLVEAHWLDKATADSLLKSYWYLRDLEHRIQMVADQQLHELPEDKDELKAIALMMGDKTSKSFGKNLLEHLGAVETGYADLFEKEVGLSDEAGNLSFTSEDDDPDTLKTLQTFGYKRPSDIIRIVRNWHRGRYRATQSEKARERLTELGPQLLRSFGDAKEPDEALLKFDAFLSGLPAGIQLFSLLNNNPSLLSMLQTIMTCAPRLADIIAHRPHIFDGMLDPAALSELPTRHYLETRLDLFLEGADYYEIVLDRLRIFNAEQKFLIGVRLLTGAITGTRAAVALSDLADLMICQALRAVEDEVASKHGTIPGGKVAVLGMGKLASREMTAGSDVDVILIYDHDQDVMESDVSEGQRALDPVRYYARLTQRLIAALSAPTSEGVLYEVDLRLRPSGNKGPVATSIKAFSKYQREEAWVWEHMALSRARCVAGDADLMDKVHSEIRAVLAAERDHANLVKEVTKMRKLIDQEKPPQNMWDFKLIPGGLVDIEFVVQYLSLRERANGWEPLIHETSTSHLLEVLAVPQLGVEQSDELSSALKLWTELSQMIKLCIEGEFELEEAPSGFQDVILRSVNLPDMNILQTEIETTSKRIRTIFNEVVRLP
ncbi:MAG: bifunctional [glutamine synthetase] adenylyltransferase/[glutamine synthetase]-adenylyl-L-tyrosine phosphorylase [Rhizobiaceae bacterium]|nr:bifunctional [glutamine synthetase] adenylyltransferase/[glutamine synthetase]-adenylyl-L-tyrosine phosphorylase [Rhizobiaceae bacterium]